MISMCLGCFENKGVVGCLCLCTAFSAICSIIIDFSHCSTIHVHVAVLFHWSQNSYCKFHSAKGKFSTSTPPYPTYPGCLNHSCILCLEHWVTSPLNHFHLFHMGLLIWLSDLLCHSQVIRWPDKTNQCAENGYKLTVTSCSHIPLLPTFYKTHAVSSLWMCKSCFLIHHLPI